MKLLFRSVFTFLILIASHSITGATNADSLVSSIIKIPKPFLIINVTSTDCISCRGAASKTLEDLKKHIASDKVVLLSDDKMMEIYFKKYLGIYGNFKTYINKELSQALTDNAKSKLCLVEEKGTSIYSIPLNESKIKEIASVIESNTTNKKNGSSLLTNFQIKDSLFKTENIFFEAQRNIYLLYNDQYQIGLLGSDGEGQYLEPTIEDSTINLLYGLLSKYVSHDFLSDSESKQVLLPLTMPTVYIKSYRFSENKCYVLFKLNTVFEQPRIKETERKVGVFGRFFFGEMSINGMSNKNMLNVSECAAYSWLDTTNYGDDLYMPLVDKGFEVNNDTVFLPVIRTDNKGNHLNDLEINVAKYKFSPNGKLIFTGVFQNHAINKPDVYSIRKEYNGVPVILNKRRKSVIFINSKKELLLNDYIKERDSLTAIFDIIVNGENLIIIGNNVKKENVQGIFDLKNNTLSLKKLNDLPPFSDAVFFNNSLYTYTKDNNENLIIFKEIQFPLKK